jgi:hypothetical protein
MIMIRRGYERPGIEVAAMTSAARDWRWWLAMVIDLADVLRVDFLNHSHHQAGGGFLRLGVVGEVEARAPVGANVLWVGGMAGAALGAERGLPLVHQFVDLIASHGFGQDLQVGRRRRGTVSMFVGRGATGGLLG